MKFELTVARGELLLSPRVPEGLASIKVPGSDPRYGMWGANKILLQSKSTFAGQVMDIYQDTVDTNQLIAKYQHGILFFHLSLEGSIEYVLEGLSPVLLHERQYTIHYVPFFLAHLIKGLSPSRSLMICTSPGYLAPYCPGYPHIRNVTQKIKASHAVSLSDSHYLADYNLLARVKELQQVTHPMEIAHLTYEVLDMAMSKLLFHRPVKQFVINRNTIEQFYRIRKIITTNLNQEYTLAELEQMSSLSNYELKILFPRFFGVSTRTMLLESRMAQAEVALNMGDKMPVIARSLGYSDESGLRRAFVKFFGIPPEEYRQRSRKNDAQSGFVAYRNSG